MTKAFGASHPDNFAQATYLASNNPPANYAESEFVGFHSFIYINKNSKTTLVRWHFVPQDGVKRLSEEELKRAPADFLEQALMERTVKSPVRWAHALSQASDQFS